MCYAMGVRKLLSCAVILLASCATDGRDDSEDEQLTEDTPGLAPGRGEVLPTVEYGDTAEENFKKGEVAFAEEEYLAAQRYYAFVRAKFPYSRFAVLSDLRVGDCQFQRKRYIESIDSYQNFVRLHPSHEKVPDALFQTAQAYYEQIPSNFFLLPPAHEKDQSAVRDAERALTAYVDRFPKHSGVEKAKELRAETRRRLLAHEQYAADFYKNLDRDRAYVGRLEIIRRDFADVGLTDELLWEIAEVWQRLKEPKRAAHAARQLKKDFPQSSLLQDATRLITATSTSASS